MTPTLLLPALAVVLALTVLTLSLRVLERELVALRRSLRRAAVTAVAVDDLGRTSANVRRQAAAQARETRDRITRRPRWWDQQRPDAR